MKVHFYKYQGTGNDFIIIDNRTGDYQLTTRQIVRLCDRKYGVGADGLILFQNDPDHDFFMNFYNPDGSQSFCGNGSRCTVHFAQDLGVIRDKCSFRAIDGVHESTVSSEVFRIHMKDVQGIKQIEEFAYYLNTGSPHYVEFVDQLNEVSVFEEGRAIRYDSRFAPGGTNVNFVEIAAEGHIRVRTYERGVENETLSCGTGVTACALAYAHRSGFKGPIKVTSLGGDLQVLFEIKGSSAFHDIWLCGPSLFVFEGNMEC